MGSPNIVNMMAYVQTGRPYPKKLNIKGIVTAESVVGYLGYTKRKESRSNDIYDIKKNRNGYLEYTKRKESRIDREIKTYTNKGWIKTDEEYKEFKKETKNCLKNKGDIAWFPVSSFKDYFTARQYQLFNEEDYAVVFEKTLNKFFDKAGFDKENMLWSMDYHNNKNHPHVHVIFTEKIKTKKHGEFTLEELNYFKYQLFSNATMREERINKNENIEKLKTKDRIYKKMDHDIKEKIKEKKDGLLIKKIVRLYQHMDEDKYSGRLQYNSFLIKPYKKELDEIIDFILDDEIIKGDYLCFVESCKKCDAKYKEETNSDFSNILNIENEKLCSSIGNYILQEKKNTKTVVNKNKKGSVSKRVALSTSKKGFKNNAIEQAMKIILSNSKKLDYETKKAIDEFYDHYRAL
ncbi:MAG: hypothetical protein WBO70_02800 [Erysipelotrichaceae bacterium]